MGSGVDEGKAVYAPEELAGWCGGQWLPRAPDRIGGVSKDTRSLQPLDLYVALRGENFDGLNFVGGAFDKGAAGALVEWKGRSLATAQRPLLLVRDAKAALRAMATGYRLKVSPTVVGITGSAGKSTVKEMTAQILAQSFSTARTRGNWNNDIGLPLSLLTMDADADVGVFELGTNHPGEIADLCKVLRPDWGVVTSIGAVHTEFFGSIEGVAAEKGSLLASLPEDGVAFLNHDMPLFDRVRERFRGACVTVSTEPALPDVDYACTRRDAENRDVAIEERATGESFVFSLPAPGRHNVANGLLAIAVARRLGMDWSRIRRGLDGYVPLGMRWEPETIGGTLFINDAYNASPLSMRAALDTFGEMRVDGDKWVLLSDMLELGDTAEQEHRAIGELVAAGPWRGLIAVGELGRAMAEGARAHGMSADRIFCCGGVDEAAEFVRTRILGGGAVLLKASRGKRLEKVIERLRELEEEGGNGSDR